MISLDHSLNSQFGHTPLHLQDVSLSSAVSHLTIQPLSIHSVFSHFNWGMLVLMAHPVFFVSPCTAPRYCVILPWQSFVLLKIYIFKLLELVCCLGSLLQYSCDNLQIDFFSPWLKIINIFFCNSLIHYTYWYFQLSSMSWKSDKKGASYWSLAEFRFLFCMAGIITLKMND